ncbi:hypothetical protein G6F56_013697 [Rhizopus delemar]|nr:hypothetical protein G6F56_013697 [Rhizopus delemar]
MSVLELPCGDAAFSNFFLFLPILLARDHGPCTQTPEQYTTSILKQQELRGLPNIVHKSRDRQYILQAEFRTRHPYTSSMVQWLGSVAFTDMAGVRFPVGEVSKNNFYYSVRSCTVAKNVDCGPAI